MNKNLYRWAATTHEALRRWRAKDTTTTFERAMAVALEHEITTTAGRWLAHDSFGSAIALNRLVSTAAELLIGAR